MLAASQQYMDLLGIVKQEVCETDNATCMMASCHKAPKTFEEAPLLFMAQPNLGRLKEAPNIV